MRELLYLSQEEVIAAGGLDMALAVPTMEEVFRLYYQGDYVLPSKSVVRWGGAASETTKGRINSMPGWIGGPIQAVGIKWIASAPQNPFKYGLPRASALIILNDPQTLVPIAVMDGTVISAARTGANTGVAAKYLARSESAILALIGAGVQNRTQLLALHHVLPGLKEVRIYDIFRERAAAFAAEMSPPIGLSIRVADTPEGAVKAADVVVTATVTEKPIIKPGMLEEGVFYSHVGSHECEFDTILAMDKIVVDSWEEIKHRGVETLAIMHNKGIIDDGAITAQLGDIVGGGKPGRETSRERIYLNTVGMGIEDVALAAAVHKRAVSMGLGRQLTLWETPFAK